MTHFSAVRWAGHVALRVVRQHGHGHGRDYWPGIQVLLGSLRLIRYLYYCVCLCVYVRVCVCGGDCVRDDVDRCEVSIV